MKKRRLEILLEKVEGFCQPSPEKEQYATPAKVAAEMLYFAYLRKDLGLVCDLGCGTGVLAIGAALLGARAIGVDIDPQALQLAKANATRLGAEDVDFVQGDASSIELKGIETVLMNPPFGAQWASKGDRAFFRKAIQLGNVVYSLANLGSEGFIRRLVEPCTIDEVYCISFPLKRCFPFHSQDVKTIDVELYRIDCSAA